MKQPEATSDLVLFFQKGEGSPIVTPKVTGVTAYLPAFQLKKTAGPYEAQITFFNLPVVPGTPVEAITVSPDGQTVRTARLTRRRGEYVVGENYIHFSGLGQAASTGGVPWIPLATGAGVLGLILYNLRQAGNDADVDGDEDEEESAPADEEDEDEVDDGEDEDENGDDEDEDDNEDDDSSMDNVDAGDDDGDADEDDSDADEDEGTEEE